MRRLWLVPTVALAAFPLAAAQTPSVAQHITGCLQRAPAGLEREGRYVLMNASTSPLGGGGVSEIAPSEPSRASEPVERRPGQSDARQETGGVSFVLQGGSDLDARVGQRVDVLGTIGPEVLAPPTWPTTAQPMPTVQVKQVRAVAATCHAPQP